MLIYVVMENVTEKEWIPSSLAKGKIATQKKSIRIAKLKSINTAHFPTLSFSSDTEYDFMIGDTTLIKYSLTYESSYMVTNKCSSDKDKWDLS